VIGAVRYTDLDKQGSTDVKDQNVVYCAGLRERIDIKALESGLPFKGDAPNAFNAS